jgi:exopolysaccharide biosynthesis protein
LKKIFICLFLFISLFAFGTMIVCANSSKFYSYKQIKRSLNGKPAVINVFTVNPKRVDVTIKPSYASQSIGNLRRVQDIAFAESALAAVNASYFKPDSGVPLGASIIDRKVITGPLYDRVVFGITGNNDFKMAKMKLNGKIFIGKDIELPLFNINQPVFSGISFSLFTPEWGLNTPKTSNYYTQIVVNNYKIQSVTSNSVQIPPNGFVIIGPKKLLPENYNCGDLVFYETYLSPDDWFDVVNAVGGGPYLVKDGSIFIDKQRFRKDFLWDKEPRTAVGYTKSGILILVTVDGRSKNSYGASLTELAELMFSLGAYNAMNLDGGTSTQMVINGQIVNTPTVKGGARVTNALVIKLK